MKTVITLTRPIGCGGGAIGKRLADRLGFQYLDRDILDRAARELGLAQDEVAAREEKVSGFWDRLKEMMALGPTDGLLTPPPPQTAPDDYIHAKECMIMTTVAGASDCVIVGRGASAIFHDCDDACHIFLHAPVDFRIRRVMHYYHAKTEKEARHIIARSDRERGHFMRRVRGMDWSRISNYHLCIDTSLAPLNEIAALIAGYVHSWRQREVVRVPTMATLAG